MSAPTMQPELTREQLERLYEQLMGVLPILARTLNKPNPILSREERRATRRPLAGYDTLDVGRSDGDCS